MDFNEELKDKIVHSGTSLVGIVCKDGVVMAGDRKATLGGQIVADKNAEKVDVERAMRQHIIGKTELIGLYSRE